MDNHIISTIADFTARVLGVTTIEELLIHVQDFIDSNFNTIQTAIYLYSPQENKLKMYHTKGFSEDEVRIAEETALERHPGWVFKTGEILYIPDSTNSNFPHLRIVTERTRFGSRLFVPVRNDCEIIGAFGIVSSETDAFNKNDIDLLTFLSNVAGTAFSKLRESAKKKEYEDRLLLHDRALFYISSGVVIADAQKPDFPIVYVNKAFERITGYSEYEVIGKNCRFLQGDQVNQPEFETLRSALKRGLECSVIVKNFKKDGTEFWNELTLTPIFSEAGILTHFIGIQNDITNKIRFEQQLKEISTRVSAIIRNLQAGIVVEDHHRRVVIINDEFMNIFSIPGAPEDLIGSDCREAAENLRFLFNDSDKFVARINEILSEKKIVKGEELSLKDGRILVRDYIPVFIQDDYSGHLWQYKDVTELKLNRILIEESEKKYKQIVENATDLIFSTTANGRFTYVNQGVINLLGYSREELIKKAVFDLVREDERSNTRRFYIEQLRTGNENTYLELPVVSKDGKVIWLGQSTRLARNDSNDFYFDVVARDITERVFFENEVKRLKNFYEQILNDLPGQIAVFDDKFNYIFINPASIRDTELRNWLTGKNDYDYVEKRGLDLSVAENRWQKLNQVYTSRKQLTFEEQIRRPDGEIKSFFRVISPILNPDGVVKYLIGYGFDITDLKQAQEALIASQNQLSAVLKTIGEAIIVFDSKGYITMVNNEAEACWGFIGPELSGKHFFSLFKTDEFTVGKSNLNFESVISEFENNSIEKTAVRKDGSLFPAELKITRTYVNDLTIFTAAAVDITRRKKVMEELIAAKYAAEASTRAKEQFLAHTSHEIRTPMNAVLGLTGLLLEMNPTEEQRQFLENIKSSGENLLVIINDILDLSKIEAGKIEFASENFSLSSLINQVIRTAQFAAKEKNLYLRSVFDENMPDFFTGDTVRLNQILLNLITNGIKFTETGGITITVRLIRIFKQKAELEITVSDTGTGISESDLKTIFEPFKQINSSGSKGKKEGSGLGLSIVKLLLEKLGGSITASSTPGSGSDFKVRLKLPIAKNENLVEVKNSGQRQNIRDFRLPGVKILIVEDNTMNQLVVANTLKLWGAVFDIAANGQEALEKLKENNYDCILMDLSMPVMNGFEASKRIRKDFPTPKKDTPIIALTASVLLTSRDKVYESGMNCHLAKPFRPADLFNKIRELINPEKIMDAMPEPESLVETPPAIPSRITDLTVIEELTEGNPDLMIELIEQFILNTPEYLQEAAEAVKGSDYAKLAAISHKMKPTFHYMGMEKTRETIQQLENYAKNNADNDKCASLLESALSDFNRGREELIESLNKMRKKQSQGTHGK